MNKEKRPLDEVEPIELDVWYLGHRDEVTIVTNIMAALQDDVANIVISPSKQRREREQPSTGKWSDSDVKKLLEDYRVANREIYLNPVIWFDKLNDEK